MRWQHLLPAALLVLAACANDRPSVGPPAPSVSTAELLNTYWKLVRLGDQVIATPPGAREIHFVLHSGNPRVAGFSGCNPMMGNYVLNGDQIKFDQVAGTLMACVPDMDLERKFLAIFPRAARWKISGETLRLLDDSGATLATFDSVYLQ